MLSNILGFFASGGPSIDWYTLPKGTAIEGGYFAGIINQDDGPHAVILAPKSSETTRQIKTTNTATVGTTSNYNGLANTAASVGPDHPAAEYCRAYSGGGYTDWYLPARDELEVAYRNLKPTTTSNSITTRSEDGAAMGTNASSVPAGIGYTAGAPSQTNVTIFQDSGPQALSTTSYATSSQAVEGQAAIWRQHQSNGAQSTTAPNLNHLIRPVRRVKA